ncbi:MAG: response regulator [Verrucomicrobia bacterium]|nr:response regulator [Verrucomicrobiota bacterium]
MTTPVPPRRRVLFVDDDPQYLGMLREIMQSLSVGSWDVLVAGNAGEALPLVQDQSVDLIVIDVRMPVLDGLQFLRLLNRRYPGLLKVVLTGFATEAYRAACLGSGAELFLEKPVGAGSHERLFAMLDGLMQEQTAEGFRGVLLQASLQDVIQMQCLAASSSVLEVEAECGQGRIFIRGGALIHAESGSLRGEPALYHLLAQRGGEFRLRALVDAPAQTIEAPWEMLLMEAARLREEAAPPPALGDQVELAQDRTVQEKSEPDLMPAALPEPESLESPKTSRAIEEFLICSGDGKVLYEWGCRNSDLWINFLEFLSQKCRRLAQGLPLGPFHRLEATADHSRLVALVQENRGVVVRSREEASNP